MPFHNPNPFANERILAFGGSGLGKSFNLYTIARLSARTGSDAKFYIIDTDESVGRMVSDDQLKDALLNEDGSLTNIEYRSVYDWESLMTAMTEFTAKMRRQDWLVVDMVSPAWEWVQGYFADEMFSKDLATYFLEARKHQSKNEGAFEGWKDWPVINTLYKKFANLLLRCPGNLYCMSEVKAINSDQTEKDTKLMFGPFGVVPVGQKRNPYLFQTVLWNFAHKPGEYMISAVKDRARQQVLSYRIHDFAVDYLVNVAGWKLA